MSNRYRPMPTVADLADQLTERYHDREWAERIAPRLWTALEESEDTRIDRVMMCNRSAPFRLFRMPECIMNVLAGVVFEDANTLEHYREIRNDQEEASHGPGR